MLIQLAKLAKAKTQANITLRHLDKDRYLFGMAPANAGTDKVAPLIAKGSLDEIGKQLLNKIIPYIADASKPAKPLEKPTPDKKKPEPKPEPEKKPEEKPLADPPPKVQQGWTF